MKAKKDTFNDQLSIAHHKSSPFSITEKQTRMLYPVTSQKALIAKTAGNVDLTSGVEIPEVEDNEVLIKVEAIAINPVDWKTLAYSFTAGAISGCDFAGTVAGPVGRNCQRQLDQGTRVCGWIMGANPMRPSNGSFAEYLAAKADLLFLIPDDMSMETAATIGMGASTGGFALFKSLGLSYRERRETPSSPSVLIYGGATSSGTMAIQLLKRAGYRSITVCSQTNFDMVKSLGAAEAFDYHSPTCGEDIRAYTRDNLFYAMDCISSSSSMNICYAALSSKHGCRYLSLDPFPSRIASLRPEVQAEWILAFTMLGDVIALEGEFRREATPEDYDFGKDWQFKVTRLLAEGKLKAHPVKMMAGGLAGAKEGLGLVQRGQVSASKLVYHVP